jgi:hypothetical protein
MHAKLYFSHLNYWGVHPVACVSSNVNKPPYTTMFLVLVFIVRLHYIFRPLIGGHLQVICDKIYSKVATLSSLTSFGRRCYLFTSQCSYYSVFSRYSISFVLRNYKFMIMFLW